VRYQREGLPPFRALVMDYPDDPEVWAIDDQYLMGESLLVTPIVAGAAQRAVYLPQGTWFDYWTGERYAGSQRITVEPPLERIPLFVKAGTLLPLAQPTLHTQDPASYQLTVLVFGDGSIPATLYEDDGSGNPSLAEVRLEWEAAIGQGKITRPDISNSANAYRYSVIEWKQMA
jgi:alpha-D-xyloside xylohydrolase